MRKHFKWWDKPMTWGNYATLTAISGVIGAIYGLAECGYLCGAPEWLNKLKDKFIHR